MQQHAEKPKTAQVVPRIPNRIEVGEFRSVVFWARRFGVTPARLLRAVSEVGASAADVARHLDHSGQDGPQRDN